MTQNLESHIVLPAWRSRMLYGLLILSLIGLVGRAFYLQGMHKDFLQQKGSSRYSRVLEMGTQRGMITDRHGEPLAISTPVDSVKANPRKINATPEQLKKLADLIETNVTDIKKNLNSRQRDFVWLKRHVSPDIAEKITQLAIPGISLVRDFRRYYPTGEQTSHMLGFTDLDDNGQEGIELALQKTLAGGVGSRRIIWDGRHRVIEGVGNVNEPTPGKNIALSIDSKIQYLAYRELKQAIEVNQAKAGGIVVLDTQTGEVLALVNLPTYNPNNRMRAKGGRARNRSVIDTFEPGSTLKPFTVAAALEARKVTPNMEFQTAPGTLTIGNRTIHDTHNYGRVTVEQVIQKSSNVGAAKIALLLSPQTQWETLSGSGFGASTGSKFPGEANGTLHPFKKWGQIEQATISYGYGISVSLLQLARAYTLFSSEGYLKSVSLLKIDAPVEGKQVISRDTALAVSKMLEMVVGREGTAQLAQINGYRVAGKTATTHKTEGRGYSKNRYTATFVGYAPASNPRLIVAVMLDEPSAGQHFGGQVAAPIFSRVMGRALEILNIPHDTPIKNMSLLPITLNPKGDV